MIAAPAPACSGARSVTAALTEDQQAEQDEDGHDHGHWDPHYWMDPGNAAVMVRNLQEGFALADPVQER